MSRQSQSHFARMGASTAGRAKNEIQKNVHKLWLAFFGIWFFFLTGLLDPWIGSPGLKQWYKVQSSLNDRRQEVDTIEKHGDLLRQVTKQLESNTVAQEREIRRVLGYLGDHEVVFEFNR